MDNLPKRYYITALAEVAPSGLPPASYLPSLELIKTQERTMTETTKKTVPLAGSRHIWLEPFDDDASMLMLSSPNGSSLPPADFTTHLMIGGKKHAVTFAFSGGIKGQKLYRASAIAQAEQFPNDTDNRLHLRRKGITFVDLDGNYSFVAAEDLPDWDAVRTLCLPKRGTDEPDPSLVLSAKQGWELWIK